MLTETQGINVYATTLVYVYYNVTLINAIVASEQRVNEKIADLYNMC